MFTIISKELSKAVIGGEAIDIDCTLAANSTLPECVTTTPPTTPPTTPTGKSRK